MYSPRTAAAGSRTHSTLIKTPLLILLTYVMRVLCKNCFRFEEELHACAQKHNLPVPKHQVFGYDFGYGSLNETFEMCRTKGHITVFQCMQAEVAKKCRNGPDEAYLNVIWSFTLDTKRSLKAANYMCHEHNLRIFSKHKDGCLREQERNAELCSQLKNETMRDVVLELRMQSGNRTFSPEAYLENLKYILTKYECTSTLAKIACLNVTLRDKCHRDAVLLIVNYFKETLPPDCVFYNPSVPSMSRSHSLLAPPPPQPDVTARAQYDDGHAAGRHFDAADRDVMSDFPAASSGNPRAPPSAASAQKLTTSGSDIGSSHRLLTLLMMMSVVFARYNSAG
ncbi:hypothetical protein AAHC03_09126 [Spirometra sp. Aus1]